MFERKRAQPQTKASLQSQKENDPKNQWKGDQRRKAAIPAQRWGVKEESRKRRLMSSNSSLRCPVIAQGCPSPACLFAHLFLFCVPPESNVQTAANQFRCKQAALAGVVTEQKRCTMNCFFFFLYLLKLKSLIFFLVLQDGKQWRQKKNQIKWWKF